MRDIEDYIDELEDLAWNNADSYKINRVRNKITELLSNTRQEDFRDWIVDNWSEVEESILNAMVKYSKQKPFTGKGFQLRNIVDRNELEAAISEDLKKGLLNVIDTYRK